ncbi:hypothetical protein D3C78_772180 [compost metagenome]
MTVARQAFAEQGIEQAEQQRRIASRADKQMLVGNRRCLAAPRVDHHHLAAPCLNRLQTLFHVRHGHDAAIGGQRVAAQDQHEIGVVDVGNRQQQPMAVHQMTGQVMGQLVDRSRGVAVAGFQQAEEIVAVGHQPIVVHAGVALVHRDGVLAMALLNRCKAFSHQGKRVAPGNRLPLAAHALHGVAQAIGIVLDILQGHRLGADMAATEAVLRVALD